ncbi:MAG: adenine phosphoribosyltransferase, partial [Nocardioides sp.]|nr:adenine phosphoribosyltransferase [Nocardioides sp.]
RATAELVQTCGAEVVGVAVLLDLAFLPWRRALGDIDVTSLLSIE